MMKLSTWLFVGLLLAAGPVCAREFPLCLYGVYNPADLKTIKKAGFSCFQTYQTAPDKLELLAKQAKQQGLKVVFYPDKLIGTEYEKKAQKWPILAWYLVDEPDVHRWSRERVTAAHQAAKTAWPKHDTTLVIGQGKTKIPFYDLPDIMMMDWYPVPHYPLTSFGDNVRYTREGMARTNHQDRPLWGVVQIFDWKEFKQFRPDNDRIGRFPTEEEIRFMSYDGIWNGATGLFYFVFTTKGGPLPKVSPEYWERVKNVVGELSRFRPVLEKGVVAENPVSLPKSLRMKTWKYKGHLYSILLNVSDKPQLVPDALLTKRYTPLYSTKRQAQIPPHAVWVLKK